MSNLSRRSLVTSAAALPALAVPAVAVAAFAEPDPIFAAIERWKEACAVETVAFDAESDASEAFRDRYGSYAPSGLPKNIGEAFKTASFKTHIDDLYGSMSTHEEIAAIKTNWLAEHTPFFHRELNKQTDDYEANVEPYTEAANWATEKRVAAMDAIFATVPTTLAGIRAKIDFAVSMDRDFETFMGAETEQPLRDFLNTLYESTRLLAVQS
jgi:hypothetical protein